MLLPQLRRIRWAVRAALILGALAFVSALVGVLVNAMIVLVSGPMIDRLLALAESPPPSLLAKALVGVAALSWPQDDRERAIAALEKQMREAAANLEFELAAMLRDQLNELKAMGAPDVRRASVRLRRQA